MNSQPAVSARRAGASVLASSLISGVSGYVVLVLAARHLSPAENADFLVFWGCLFGVFGVLTGLTGEMTRAVFTAGRADRDPRASLPGARAAPVGVAVGFGFVTVLTLVAPVWGPPTMGDDWVCLCVTVAVGAVLFTVHASLAGASAGRAVWPVYAAFVSAEAVVRVLFVAGAGLLGSHVVGHAIAAAGAAGTWLLIMLLRPRTRSLWSVRSDVPAAGLARRFAVACMTAAASAVFLVAFPVLVRVTTSDAVFAGAAPLILAVSLTRAPLLMPLGAFQSIIITQVITRGARALVVPIGIVAGATLVGTGAAALVGPPVLATVHSDYVVEPHIFALLTLAAGLVASQSLIAASALALDRHGGYLVGWIVTSVVAILALGREGSLDERVVGALLLGPLIGGAVHLLVAVGNTWAGTRLDNRKAD